MTLFINKNRNRLTFIAGALILSGLVFHLLGWLLAKNIALLVATLVAGVPVAMNAYQALRLRVFSIELLVTIAVLGALYLGEYVESSVVTFLFLFGAYLEGRTLEKTRESIKKLVDMAPQEAVVIRDGDQVTISVDDVVIGDRIVIRSGGKVAVDGRVVSGTATLNEALMTGESKPQTKEAGDLVYSGTIVDNGYIEIIAEKVGDDTSFAKIIELVEEAQDSKSKTEKFLDRFAHYYTPGIVIIAVIVYIITRNLHMAITFLVVACPGALVIGAPVSNVAGIGNGARHGVLVKGGEVMERLSKIDTIVFDKTGTLTKGRPVVTDIKVFVSDFKKELTSLADNSIERAVSEKDKPAKAEKSGESIENDFLRLMAEAETISEHHLGMTIVREAEARGLDLVNQPTESEVIKGNGITALIDGQRLVIGTSKLMESNKIEIPEEIAAYALEREKAGNTAILAAVDGTLTGVISIADQIRDDAQEALAGLRANGIKKIIMLTGDNRHTAELVANELGLDEFYAELLPEDKVKYVKKLKESGANVAMAGDGINDAPAIATADIGLAMGEGGTDVSMETADVVLMADRLTQFSHAFALAKATIANMKQNIFFAVATVILLLVGVLADTIHLASGMFIHEGSILVVILNAMRLIRFKP